MMLKSIWARGWRLAASVWARAAGASAIYLAGAVLARVGSFVLIPIYTRALSLVEYGDYALAQSLVMLIQTLLTSLFLTSAGRFFFDEADPVLGRRRAGAVIKSFLPLVLAATSVAEVLVLIFGASGPGLGGRWELSCMVVGGAGAALAAIPYQFLRLEQRPIAASSFNLGQFLTSAVSGAVLVAGYGRGVRGCIEAMGLSGVLNGVGALLFIAVYFRGARGSVSALRDSVRFSVPLLLDTLIQYARGVTDRWILKAAGLGADLGAYALANQLMVPASMVTNAWNDSESARIGEMYRRGGIARIAQEQRATTIGYFLAGAISVAGTLLAIPLLTVIVGKGDFTRALWLLPLVGASVVIEALYSPPLYLVFYASRTRRITYVTVVTGCLMLAATFALIPLFGVLGAIAAKTLATTARVFLIRREARRCVVEELETHAPDAAAPNGR